MLDLEALKEKTTRFDVVGVKSEVVLELISRLEKAEVEAAAIRITLEFCTWNNLRTRPDEPAWCSSCGTYYPKHLERCRIKLALASDAGASLLKEMDELRSRVKELEGKS